MVDLAADLQSHDEEEDHHQPVVDDPLELALESERTDANAERRVPEVRVALRPWRVRAGERDGCRDEQQDAARGFDAKEPLERATGETREPQQRLPGLRRGDASGLSGVTFGMHDPCRLSPTRDGGPTILCPAARGRRTLRLQKSRHFRTGRARGRATLR